jgi:hypothetical protein
VDNHKVFGVGEKVVVSVTYTGDCWNNQSKIKFSFSNAQLYFSNENGGNDIPVTADQEYSLTSLLPIYLIANTPSSTWDTVTVSATAYPNHNLGSSSSSTHLGHSNTPRSSSDSGTAYQIAILAKEKPWGGTWNEVEDSGTYSSRSWYHMWSINENAICANVTPSCLAQKVTDTSFTGISTDVFSSGSPGTVTPPWKKITSGIGLYLPVKAVVVAGGVSLQGNNASADIVMNDIEQVEWEPVSESASVSNEQGTEMYLAELKTPATLNQIYYYDELWSIYPTFSPKPNEQALNQARVKVTLKQNIPSGMLGTVHLDWFDPKDWEPYQNVTSNSGETWVSNSNGDGHLKKDNRAALAFSNGTGTLTFGQSGFTTSTVRKAIVEFSEGFGDNFIVAVHPNSGIAQKYRLDTNNTPSNPATDRQNLLIPTGTILPSNMRTPAIYVASWNGFKVPKEWLYNEAEYSIATAIDKNGGESYTKSVLNVNDEFGLTLNFQFDRSRGNGGYVKPDGYGISEDKKTKLSFVPNSGVKIGNTLGATSGGYEIAILDVDLMVSMVGGMSVFQKNETEGIQNTGNVVDIPVLNSNLPSYATEPLSKLMNGIGYGKDYTKMYPYNNADGNEWQKYWNTLNNNVNDTGLSNTIAIQKTANYLTVQLNGIANYFVDTEPPAVGDGHLYLQSHWGSGVTFTSASIQLN